MRCQVRGRWDALGCVEGLPTLRNWCRSALRLGIKSTGRSFLRVLLLCSDPFPDTLWMPEGGDAPGSCHLSSKTVIRVALPVRCCSGQV